jgi:hypothetical protein
MDMELKKIEKIRRFYAGNQRLICAITFENSVSNTSRHRMAYEVAHALRLEGLAGSHSWTTERYTDDGTTRVVLLFFK